MLEQMVGQVEAVSITSPMRRVVPEILLAVSVISVLPWLVGYAVGWGEPPGRASAMLYYLIPFLAVIPSMVYLLLALQDFPRSQDALSVMPSSKRLVAFISYFAGLSILLLVLSLWAPTWEMFD